MFWVGIRVLYLTLAHTYRVRLARKMALRSGWLWTLHPAAMLYAVRPAHEIGVIV